MSFRRPRRLARLRRALAVLLVSALAAGPLALVGATPAWAAGTLGLTQQLSFGGSAGADLEVPSGSSLVLALNFSCGGQDCVDGVVTAVIPAGLQVGSVAVVAGASSTVVGNTITVTLPPTLTAGSAGQITAVVTVPSWSTADGAVFAWQSTLQGTGSATATSNSVSITSRAQSVTSASIAKTAGGTTDEPVNYVGQACVQAAPNASAVAVAAGAVAVVTLPPGAVFRSAEGGNHAAGQITWILPQVAGCAALPFVVEYPSSDPANGVGGDKTVTVSWSGNFVGEAGTIPLGSAQTTDTLVAPVVDVRFSKWSFSSSAATTTGITWFLALGNHGNTTADELRITDDIPDPMQVTSIGASMPTIGTTPGEVWIASKYGADGVDGTGDDGVAVLAAELPVSGAGVGIGVYGSGTWPSGAAQLPADDLVVSVEVVMYQVPPGAGGDRVSIAATVLEESWGGVTTQVGDVVTNTASYTSHIVSGALDETDTVDRSHQLTIAPQVTTITPMLGGGGTLAPGVRTGTGSLSGTAGPFPLRNPVFTLIVPSMIDLTSWTPSSTTVLPAPTLTTVPDWAGGTSTLYRWTYPAGTVLAPGTGYSIDWSVELDEQAWGTLAMRGYVSSSSDPYGCTWNFFEGGPDAEDKDGDGDTAETLCNWNTSFSPAPSTSASVRIEVDSAYSAGFETGTVYTAPGSADTYRVAMRNSGTLPVSDVVVVATLPRPGDTTILTGAGRNPATTTFPVLLTGAATGATPGTTPTIWYDTVASPCLPELGSSPAGCAPADWSTTLPADPSTVAAIKIDYGSATLDPFTTWSVDLPVIAPATGATEPEFAAINPDPTDPAGDERAAGSAAFAVRTQSATTLTAESAVVTLRIPNVDGAAGVPPTADDLTSTGVGVAVQSVTPHVPTGGSIRLLDGATEVTTLVVPGEGEYSVDPAGVLTFRPVLGFQGVASPVRYVVRNAFAVTATAGYTATVTPPAAPTPPDLVSVEVLPQRTQSVSITVPTGGLARLLGPGNVALTTLDVPDEGRYVLDPATGVVTYTPALGFVGTPAPISYRVTDAYGQSADAEYAAGEVSALATVIGGAVVGVTVLGVTGAVIDGTVRLALLLGGIGALLVARERRRAWSRMLAG